MFSVLWLWEESIRFGIETVLKYWSTDWFQNIPLTFKHVK